jgi:hypothetical protein
MAMRDDDVAEVLEDENDFISVCVGVSQWKVDGDRWIIEKDYRVAGEVWRVHKNDPDPYPSRPHAHCIAGADRFVGCKLHLGTAELFRGSQPQGRYLSPKQFNRLVELIKPKFPGLILPLADN